MSIWWIIYWVSIAIVLVLSVIVRRFFTWKNEDIPRFIFMLGFAFSFIPILGTIEAFVSLIVWISLWSDGYSDLELKEKPFENEELNKIFFG